LKQYDGEDSTANRLKICSADVLLKRNSMMVKAVHRAFAPQLLSLFKRKGDAENVALKRPQLWRSDGDCDDDDPASR
jgi:hypothetical protein